MPRGTERATIASPVAPFNVLPRATVLPPLHPGLEQRRGDGFFGGMYPNLRSRRSGLARFFRWRWPGKAIADPFVDIPVSFEGTV